MEVIEFETERLRLRLWQDSDYEPFAALNADPHVMAFFPCPLPRHESDALADTLRALLTQRGWGLWAVEVMGTDSFIGFVGLHVPSIALPFSPCAEVGWRLAARHWGQGYATEAARGTLRVAFERLALAEVISFTTVSHQRSRRVMERLGMQYQGETFAHPSVPADHPLRPHVLYRLRREQWRPRGEGT